MLRSPDGSDTRPECSSSAWRLLQRSLHRLCPIYVPVRLIPKSQRENSSKGLTTPNLTTSFVDHRLLPKGELLDWNQPMKQFFRLC